MLIRIKLLIIGTILSINFFTYNSHHSHHFTLPTVSLDFFLNGNSDDDKLKSSSHHPTASLQMEWQKKQAKIREDQDTHAKLMDKLISGCPAQPFKKLMQLQEACLAKQVDAARAKVNRENAKDEAALNQEQAKHDEAQRLEREKQRSDKEASERFGKFLIAELIISSGAYIYLKLRDTEVQKYLRSTKDQLVNKLKEKNDSFNKLLVKPIGALTLTSLATLATCGYACRESIYNTVTGSFTSLQKSLSNTYNSYSNWLPSRRNFLTAGSIVIAGGLGYELYKRFYKQSDFAIALKNFNKSLEGSLKEIVSQYPRFIEVFPEIQNNPIALLDGHDFSDFDNAPFVKLLNDVQKRLLKKAISVYLKQNNPDIEL